MNPNVRMTLDEAVAEVLGLLTGYDLQYVPEADRYQAVARQLNRALRSVATEHEWNYYSVDELVGQASAGTREVRIPSRIRPRQLTDDSVRLVNSNDDVVTWAYYMPPSSLHKYRYAAGLWVAAVNQDLKFSRPFTQAEHGLNIRLSAMREPRQFELIQQPEDPTQPLVTMSDELREQVVDFAWPELIIRRAATFYAQTQPMMQPRVQTLEAEYKDLMYNLKERDSQATDAPYQNEWSMGIGGDIYSAGSDVSYHHPHGGF